jgi:hypothetical protein
MFLRFEKTTITATKVACERKKLKQILEDRGGNKFISQKAKCCSKSWKETISHEEKRGRIFEHFSEHNIPLSNLEIVTEFVFSLLGTSTLVERVLI